MNLQDAIPFALEKIEGYLGDKSFTLNGEEYACHVGSTAETAQLDGLYTAGISKILVVRKELFTDGVYPREKQTLIYNDVTYRISTVVESSTEDFFQLILEEPNKRK